MMKQLVVGGKKARPQGGAPKRFSAGRVCADPDCSTWLTVYNRNNTCFRHSPTHFPRTRTVPSRSGDATTTAVLANE